MSLPLKKVIIAIAIFIISILGCLLIFGFRQYQLQIKIENVIAQSEKIIFQFASIRENIVESIVDNRYSELSDIINDVESIHIAISDIIANSYIPNEYKLSFLNRIDLQGLVLLLRQSSSGHADTNKIQQLNRESRIMNERLLMFDRVVVDYAKSKLIAFQSIVIGALEIVVFIIVLILVMGHRYVAIPLLELVCQVRDVAQGRRNDVFLSPIKMSTEVFNLGEAFHNLLQTRLLDTAEIARYNRIFYAVHKTGIAISHAPNREDLFKDVSRALRYNEDYCLVLITELDELNGNLMNFKLEDNSNKDSRVEQFDIASWINDISEGNEKINPALRAIKERKCIVENDIFADIPTGGFLNDTIFSKGTFNCVALPLSWESRVFGAITIYSGKSESFLKEELKLLEKMASDMAFALSYLEMKNQFEWEKESASTIRTSLNAMSFLISFKGRLKKWDEKVMQITGFQPHELAVKNWQDIVSYKTDNEKMVVKNFLLSSENALEIDLLINKKNGEQEVFRCRLMKRITQVSGENDIFCICHDISNLLNTKQKLDLLSYEYRSFFDAMPSLLLIISSSGEIHDLNEKALEVFKVQKNDIVGKNILQYIYRDRPADYSSLLKSTLQEQKRASLRERFDNLLAEFLVTIVPFSVETGKDTKLVMIVDSLSMEKDHHRAEELVKVFTLTNLGELATGVAHEINNLSNGIINYAQILADESVEEDSTLSGERTNLLKKIIVEGEKIARIVQKLLYYGRDKGKNKELIRINDLIEDVLLMIKHQLKNDGIRVDLELAEGLPLIAFESSQLQLVFLSILNNSRRALNQKYTGKHDSKRIELKVVMEIVNSKKWLKIMIADWGGGIRPEIMPRIFDPVFSTNPLGDDLGMGLAVSRELIMKNNGTISVASEFGMNTVVTIELPVQYGQTV